MEQCPHLLCNKLFFCVVYSQYHILWCSATYINQKLQQSPDKKPVGLQHNPSEELKPNHALDDSLLFIFSFYVVTKRALLSASFHFSFSFYPYDLFPIPSEAYCYSPTIFKNNLFSFEFFLLFFFSRACKIAARISNLEFILLKPTPSFFSYIKDIVSFFFLLLHPCHFLRCFHPSLQLPPSPTIFPTSLH